MVQKCTTPSVSAMDIWASDDGSLFEASLTDSTVWVSISPLGGARLIGYADGLNVPDDRCCVTFTLALLHSVLDDW